MSDTLDLHASTSSPTGHAGSDRAVVFLIDESGGMNARVAQGTKSKAQSIATALNSLLNQLTLLPEIDVAVVGYRRDARGQDDVGCRWGGPLAGSQFVSTARLAASPLTVENRVRKIPGPGGLGVAREETVRFPVWYVPTLGDKSSRTAALEYCRELFSSWLSAPGDKAAPPLVVDLLGELSESVVTDEAVAKLQTFETTAGGPQLWHVHLATLAGIPPTLYPSSDVHLPPGPICDLFHRSSVLPEPLVVALREAEVAVNTGARGLACNATMADLIKLFSLVRAFANYRSPEPAATPTSVGGASPAADQSPALPPAEADTAAVEAFLVVLLLDRSNPPAGTESNVWGRLQEHANELLAQIAKRDEKEIHVAAVSYGGDASGKTEVQSAFAGPLAGREFVCLSDLADGPLRVDEVTEQVSNGIGGLVSITRKKPVFVDLQPAEAASPGPAFETARRFVANWSAGHAGTRAATVVVHLTRGRHDPVEMQQAAGQLQATGDDVRPVLLYHLVVTESPHRALAYPDSAEQIDDPELRKLWELSSPLLGRRQPAARKPTVTEQSRGIAINCKFDLLLEGIEETLAGSSSHPADPPDR